MSEITPNTPNPVREDAYKQQLAAKLGIDPQYIPGSPIWHSEEEIAAIAEMFSNMAGGSSGGGVLIITEDGGTGTLDKTWQEIHDAEFALIVNVSGQNYKSFIPVIEVNEDSGSYTVTTCATSNNNGEAVFSIGVYAASSADGYPVAE